MPKFQHFILRDHVVPEPISNLYEFRQKISTRSGDPVTPNYPLNVASLSKGIRHIYLNNFTLWAITHTPSVDFPPSVDSKKAKKKNKKKN